MPLASCLARAIVQSPINNRKPAWKVGNCKQAEVLLSQELFPQFQNMDHRRDAETSSGVRDKLLQSAAISRMQGLRERCARQRVLPVSGGSPITEQTAVDLRTLVFGQCPAPIRPEYFSRGPGLNFRDSERDLGFGLKVGEGALPANTRSALMAIQCHILRALLFATQPKRVPKTCATRPTKNMQHDAMCAALADIFWRAASLTSSPCIVCLPQATTHIPESNNFNYDGVTERLSLFQLKTYEETLILIRRYSYMFEEDPGPALLVIIYSTLLSRGIDRAYDDLCKRKTYFGTGKQQSVHQDIIRLNGEITFSALTLLLTGKPTIYLHNGVYYEGDENTYAVAQVGVTSRSPTGLLIWRENDEKTETFRLGSRLKTPIYPIWLILGGDHCGVLFSDNRDLLRDYHAEYRFSLQYYTSSHTQTSSAILSVNTRVQQEVDEYSSPLLDKIIRTK